MNYVVGNLVISRQQLKDLLIEVINTDGLPFLLQMSLDAHTIAEEEAMNKMAEEAEEDE